MKLNPFIQYENINLRLLTVDDIDEYYQNLFVLCDEEVNALTGTTQSFTYQQVESYVQRIVNDTSRYDFLIFVDNEFVGEAVLNEIEGMKGGFRIALNSIKQCNQKIGQKVMSLVLTFAFEILHLETIQLEVIKINERAIHVYKKLGFHVSQVLKNEYMYMNEKIDAYEMVCQKANFNSVIKGNIVSRSF